MDVFSLSSRVNVSINPFCSRLDRFQSYRMESWNALVSTLHSRPSWNYCMFQPSECNQVVNPNCRQKHSCTLMWRVFVLLSYVERAYFALVKLHKGRMYALLYKSAHKTVRVLHLVMYVASIMLTMRTVILYHTGSRDCLEISHLRSFCSTWLSMKKSELSSWHCTLWAAESRAIARYISEKKCKEQGTCLVGKNN